ncbi:hypothetical protein BH10PLA2_BH10PLA2_20060 [soil metagenome]
MVQSIKDFIKSHPAGPFVSTPHYFGEGDFVTYYVSDEPAFEERIDELVTVYHSIATKEIVGCKIKGVKRILAELKDFNMWAVLVAEQETVLGVLFAGAALASPDRIDVYKRVSSQFGNVRMDTKLLPVGA